MNCLRADVELGEAALHLVEGAGERCQLAGRGDRDRRLEVAVGDFAGGALQGADGIRGELGVVEAEPGGDHDRDPAADQDVFLGRPRPAPPPKVTA